MIELEVSEIKPNEFKKEINGGKLNEEQVKRLMSNIEELGLMGALPVYEKGGKYHLVNGHHRLEALKRAFGKDAKIPVIIHKYSQENVLRGMIIENLTQRNNEFKETLDNLIVIREWLKKTMRIAPIQMVKRPQGGGPQPEVDSVRAISKWLNTQGEVISKDTIASYLNINDNLDPELKVQIVKKEGSEKSEGIPLEDAKVLAKFKDKSEQKQIAKALRNTRERGQRKRIKNVSVYRNAPEVVKAKVRRGEIDLADVEATVHTEKLRQKAQEIDKASESEAKLIHTKEIIGVMRSDILDTQHQLDKMMVSIRAVRHTRFYFYKAQEKEDFFKLVRGAHTKAQKYNEELGQLVDDLELEVLRE